MTSQRKSSDEEILEKLREKQAALNRDIQRRAKLLQEKRRKERTRALIEKGGLIEIAGLLEREPQILMGAFMEIAKTITNDSMKTEEWKKQGSYILSLSPAERKEQGLVHETRTNEVS